MNGRISRETNGTPTGVPIPLLLCIGVALTMETQARPPEQPFEHSWRKWDRVDRPGRYASYKKRAAQLQTSWCVCELEEFQDRTRVMVEWLKLDHHWSRRL